jgi:hypothetical protein
MVQHGAASCSTFDILVWYLVLLCATPCCRRWGAIWALPACPHSSSMPAPRAVCTPSPSLPRSFTCSGGRNWHTALPLQPLLLAGTVSCCALPLMERNCYRLCCHLCRAAPRWTFGMCRAAAWVRRRRCQALQMSSPACTLWPEACSQDGTVGAKIQLGTLPRTTVLTVSP